MGRRPNNQRALRHKAKACKHAEQRCGTCRDQATAEAEFYFEPSFARLVTTMTSFKTAWSVHKHTAWRSGGYDQPVYEIWMSTRIPGEYGYQTVIATGVNVEAVIREATMKINPEYRSKQHGRRFPSYVPTLSLRSRRSPP